MRYRTLGRTALSVSEVVFGGGWVGGVLIHQPDEIKLATLRRAMEAGINFIDTAPLYGNGKSEEALGWLLKELDSQPYLSTKVMLDTANLKDIPGQVERSIEESLRRLRRDSVDLLQLHNPIEVAPKGNSLAADQVVRKGGAADALEQVRERGLTRFIGFTALGDGASCRQVIESGRFDTAQVYYNLLNPSAGRAMPSRWKGHDFGNLIAASTRSPSTRGTHPSQPAFGSPSSDSDLGPQNSDLPARMGIIAIRVFAAGVLASDARHGREVVITPNADLALEERRAKAVFAAIGDRYGTRAQTALRFALSHPDVSCTVIGLAEPAHLEEALQGAEKGALPKEALQQLDKLYANNFGV